MATARSLLMDKSSSGFYHCMTRCVRRAFLFGDDMVSGVNYDHRREWIASRLFLLGDIFAADIYAYAVMSNHYHVVLFMDCERAKAWSPDEVARRWLTLCPPALALRDCPDNPSESACFDGLVEDLAQDEDRIALYQERLCDLSWLMRFLNEFVARKANREDRVKGRFWEGRFKAQSLLDEGAVLACMAYVDLNPIRAGLAKTPESSEFTSIKERIDRGVAEQALEPISNVGGGEQSSQTEAIRQVSLKDYLALVDWTGRQIREGKTGYIPSDLQPILTRLQLSSDHWLETAQFSGHTFVRAVGAAAKIQERAEAMGCQWLHGIGFAKRIHCSDEAEII